MPKFYFTYGSEGHPFKGGWTEIEAPNLDVAEAVFKAFYPDGHNGFGNCCGIYDDDTFPSTTMYLRGNLGHHCHETITLRREIHTEGET